MGREVRRVPPDFDWPQDKVWDGFLMPERLHGDQCPDCESGRSPRAQELHDIWYGYLPFHPSQTGSTPFRTDTPAVRAFAERNVAHSPEYYGTGKDAIDREARRLLSHWNGMWMHHIDQDDVDALVEAGRLMDFTHTWSRETGWQPKDPPATPTAAEVNVWSLSGFGHDGINAIVVVSARCEREGVPERCATCEGRASVEAYPGQRADADAWEPTDPPTGNGWQLWETVTEGSPCSPIFADAEGLAQWLTTEEAGLARCSSIETAREFVGVGWAPTGVMADGEYMPGTEAIGRTA